MAPLYVRIKPPNILVVERIPGTEKHSLSTGTSALPCGNPQLTTKIELNREFTQSAGADQITWYSGDVVVTKNEAIIYGIRLDGAIRTSAYFQKKLSDILNYIKKQAAGFASGASAGECSWRISPDESVLNEPPSCIKKMADNWETRMNIESKPH